MGLMVVHAGLSGANNGLLRGAGKSTLGAVINLSTFFLLSPHSLSLSSLTSNRPSQRATTSLVFQSVWHLLSLVQNSVYAVYVLSFSSLSTTHTSLTRTLTFARSSGQDSVSLSFGQQSLLLGSFGVFLGSSSSLSLSLFPFFFGANACVFAKTGSKKRKTLG